MQRILDFIIGAGILQGTFLAFYLWFRKKETLSANRILALLTGAFSVNLLHSLLRTGFMPMLGWKPMGAIEPFQLLLGPLLFLFVRQRIYPVKIKAGDGIHFIPFLAILLFLIVRTVWIDRLQFPAAGMIFWGSLFLQITAYLVSSIIMVRKYNRTITDYFSEIEKKKMDWMHIFMTLLFVIYAGYFVLFFILFHRGEMGHFERLLSLLQSMAVFGLGTVSLFFETPQIEKEIEETGPYKKSPLSKEVLNNFKDKLSRLMDEQKPYLDPGLSLPRLAAEAGIPRNTLSQVINEGFSKNFYDFVNAYRVEEVARLMQSPKTSHYKILALAFDAGFNSKPAFNAVFRKITGQTPSSYKKNLK
jgi:AraC-like DNA-binding protein